MHLDAHLAARLGPNLAARTHVQHQARSSLVSDYQVRAAAQNENWNLLLLRPAHGRGHLGGIDDLAEKARRSTQS